MKKLFTLMVFMLAMNVFAQQLPNNSFENWSTSTLSTDEPDSWYSFNIATQSYPSYGTLKTTDAYDGTYAVKLVSGRFTFPSYNIEDTTALLTLGSLNYTTGTKDGYPFTGRPDMVRFYFKYYPGTVPSGKVDTALAFFKFTNYSYCHDPNNNCDNNLAVAQWRYWGDAVTTYTKVELPLTWQNGIAPDTVYANFTSGTTGFVKSYSGVVTRYANVYGNTLYIDKVEFIYNSNKLTDNRIASANIYPNPAQSLIHIDSETAWTDFGIYDLLGNKFKSGKITSTTLDVNELPSGWYILYLKNRTSDFFTRLCIK
jgi:hypothetical protein